MFVRFLGAVGEYLLFLLPYLRSLLAFPPYCLKKKDVGYVSKRKRLFKLLDVPMHMVYLKQGWE